MAKQVYDRNLSKKKLAKMHAKRMVGPSKQFIEAATRVRKKCSNLSSWERKKNLEEVLLDIGKK
jgi:hypothetical protein